MTEPKPAVQLLNQHEFNTQIVVPWMELTDDLRKSNKSMTALKKRKRDYEADMLAWMDHNNFVTLRCRIGKLSVTEKAKPGAVNKAFLVKELKELQHMDEGNATMLVDEIMEKRPIVKKRQIALSAKKDE